VASTPLAQLLQGDGYAAGQTAEAVVQCASNGTGGGNQMYYQDEYITLTAAGGYTTSANPPAGAVAPNVVVTAVPGTVQVGNSVILTATVTASQNGTPTGTVQFYDGTGTIGGLVSLAGGVAHSPATTFMTAGTHTITAAYNTDTPANWTSTLNTASTSFPVNVTQGNPLAPTELITVTVAPTGSFSIATVPANNATAPLTQSGSAATGAMSPVQVIDSRNGVAAGSYTTADGVSHTLGTQFNGYPGWSVVGQATAFTNPNSNPVGTIPASNLNWTPTQAAAGDYTLDGASTTGLGSAQPLAHATAGHGDGTFNIGANLTLTIPASAPAGAYTSTLTLTADPWVNQGI
jgi:hypothetical protein